MGNHLFVIFAVLDVSFAVNSCLNRSFLHLYLQFYYISVAVNWYRVRIRSTRYPQFLRCSCSPASPKFGTKVVIVTYSPNRSCVPILKLLTSTIAERRRGPKYLQCSLAQTSANFCQKICFLVSYSPSPTCIVNLKLLASTVA